VRALSKSNSRFWKVCLVWGLLFVSGGCGPTQAAEQPEQLQWNVLKTGKACVRAKAACGVGNCAARIANHCGQPVSCELTVQCICHAMTGESVEAIERTRDTVLAGDEVGLRAHVLCATGEVQATYAKRIHCR